MSSNGQPEEPEGSNPIINNISPPHKIKSIGHYTLGRI